MDQPRNLTANFTATDNTLIFKIFKHSGMSANLLLCSGMSANSLLYTKRRGMSVNLRVYINCSGMSTNLLLYRLRIFKPSGMSANLLLYRILRRHVRQFAALQNLTSKMRNFTCMLHCFEARKFYRSQE